MTGDMHPSCQYFIHPVEAENNINMEDLIDEFILFYFAGKLYATQHSTCDTATIFYFLLCIAKLLFLQAYVP